MKTITLLLVISSWGAAQPIPGGAINGIPIDAAAFKSPNPCSIIKGLVRSAAKQQAIAELGVSVSQDDIAKANARQARRLDPAAELKRITEHAAPIVAALSAVYDDHRDPQQVYSQMLQPKGMTPEEWRVFLAKGADAQYRKTYAETLNWTPDTMRQQIERGLENSARFIAMGDKLDEAVDQSIARNDPAFRAALANWNSSTQVITDPGGQQHVQHAGDTTYLTTHRAAWWRAREQKVSVTLNDPTLAATCGLGAK